MILTIAIPTYNRPEKLLATIKALLPQLNKETCIVIIDNCSDTIIEDHLRQNIDEVYFNSITVRRNFINIGADANFMRCFEYPETPYIWTLGDDDEIEPTAIDSIFLEIENYRDQDIIGFNFSSNYTDRQETVSAGNIDDLLEKIDNFENLLLLSASVYKRSEYIKNIRHGFWGAYSMSSTIVPALIALSNGKSWVLSKHKIVHNVPVERENKWPDARFALGLSSLLEAPIKLSKDRYKRLGKFFFYNVESFPRTACDIIKAVDYDVDLIDDYHIYLYNKIYKTSFQFRRNKGKQYVLYICWYILLKNKWALKLLLRSSMLKNYISTSSMFNIFKR